MPRPARPFARRAGLESGARLDFRPDLSAVRFAAYDPAELALPAGDLWVFAYGSLMWKPGFAVAQARPARLYGYHRRLCLWSVHYRGTARHPGLVLGLDRGGSCNGIALRVAKRRAAEVVAYLLEREMLHNAYAPRIKRVYPHGGGEGVDALTFVSRRAHPQYAHPLDLEQIVAVVRAATGAGGRNRDYVLNTARRLSALSIERTQLHAVAEKLR